MIVEENTAIDTPDKLQQKVPLLRDSLSNIKVGYIHRGLLVRTLGMYNLYGEVTYELGTMDWML